MRSISEVECLRRDAEGCGRGHPRSPTLLQYFKEQAPACPPPFWRRRTCRADLSAIASATAEAQRRRTRLNGTTLPPLDGNSSGYIQQDAIYFPPNQGNRTTDGADRTDWEPTGKRPLHPCHPEIRGKIPATPPSLMVAPPTSPIACKRTAEMILTKSALSAMLFQDFAMEPIGSMAVKTTRKPCVAIQERPRRGGGQNKPGQRGSGRACLRNAFIKGVSAWRIGNQFALSNFVLIPIKTTSY